MRVQTGCDGHRLPDDDLLHHELAGYRQSSSERWSCESVRISGHSGAAPSSRRWSSPSPRTVRVILDRRLYLEKSRGIAFENVTAGDKNGCGLATRRSGSARQHPRSGLCPTSSGNPRRCGAASRRRSRRMRRRFRITLRERPNVKTAICGRSRIPDCEVHSRYRGRTPRVQTSEIQYSLVARCAAQIGDDHVLRAQRVQLNPAEAIAIRPESNTLARNRSADPAVVRHQSAPPSA